MLPYRFCSSPADVGPEPVVYVDGSPVGCDDRPGDLHLSHWPGNRTPDALRRDLSTEVAFAFLDLPEPERERLVSGKGAFVLNHLDTDGAAALFTLVRPDAARRHRALLHEVAAAGDFFQAPSERAVAIDAALTNLTDARRSAVARELKAAGLSDDERRARMLDAMLDLLGALLEDEAAAPELWRDALERFRADREALARAAFDDLVYMDFGVWLARTGDAAGFDPGRHALFADGRLDRVLALAETDAGTTARFILGTRSFFDLATGSGSPRPDLAGVARDLNAREGTTPDGDGPAWRHQRQDGASPELWFGRPGLPLFAEHAAPLLAPSRLEAVAIKAVVLDAIRDSWALPDDDDEAEDGEDIFAV